HLWEMQVFACLFSHIFIKMELLIQKKALRLKHSTMCRLCLSLELMNFHSLLHQMSASQRILIVGTYSKMNKNKQNLTIQEITVVNFTDLQMGMTVQENIIQITIFQKFSMAMIQM